MFWKDVWLEGFGQLLQHVAHESSVKESNVLMEDMVTVDNQWRQEELAHLLLMQVLMAFASHHVPRKEMEDDTIFWSNSVSGEFIIKSAYRAQEQPVFTADWPRNFDLSYNPLDKKDQIVNVFLWICILFSSFNLILPGYLIFEENKTLTLF